MRHLGPRVSGRASAGTVQLMGYVIAALVIVLAVAAAIAIAKFLIGLVVIAAGVLAALYIWYRWTDPLHSASDQGGTA